MKLAKFSLVILFVLLTISSLGAQSLHDAICNGQIAQVKKLVTRSNVNKPMEDGQYPLPLAGYCYGGQPAIANYLLDLGANVNLTKNGDYPPIYWAIRSMEPDAADAMRKVVLRMLRMGIDGKAMNPSTKQTPLMLAAGEGDEEIVNLLIKAGANKSQRTAPGWCVSDSSTQCTAADFARLGGFVELALKLEGKDTAAYKKTLHSAAKRGDIVAIQRLINAGTDVSAQEPISKLTPLHYAVNTGKMEVVSAILAGKPNPNLQDFAGVTPLRNAVVQYKPELARLLVDAGAKADNEQSQGCGGGLTEFAWALEYSQPDVARYMIEHGAVDPANPSSSIQALYGKSPYDLEILKLLLSKGAKPTQADLDRIRKIEGANPWLQEKGHTAQIIAFLEAQLKQPVTPVTPEITPDVPEVAMEDEKPAPPSLDDLSGVRERGGAPITYKTRSLRKENPRTRNFDQKFRSQKGTLDANALWAK
ncbi:MAG: ankyrin repeat domain-containing protein [Spirochaetia bacterium]|nr:ankyrin repeat domain-containing protein [Spirochaetia bacterium]